MNKNRSQLALLVLLAASTPNIGQTQTADGIGESAASPRTVRSAAGFERERGDSQFRDRSEFLEFQTQTRRRAAATKGNDPKVAAVSGSEAWIYAADVELFDDYDFDGYYRSLRVSFDVDSLYADHYVYARLFMTFDGVNWDEYHVTNDFLINGSSSLDNYEVDTELVSGFPTDLYDVLIELYDADFGDFLAEFGPADSSAFSLLPLEDASYDAPPAPVIIINEEHGGGSSDVVTIALLLLAAAVAARRGRGARAASARQLKDRKRSRHSSDRTP
jgi:hypothetical protein